MTARGANQVIAIDTPKMLVDPDHALLGTVAVGPAPVGLAVIDAGRGLVVANSNRFAYPGLPQTAILVSARDVAAGKAMSVLGELGVGAFPREVTADASSAFVANFNSGTVSGFDLSLLPMP